jgi:tRNA threonylcarbamoyladenosine biosynthesis protein TsaE
VNRLRHLPCIDLHGLEALGRELGGLARPGDVILLLGGLGAGKTTLARAVIRALGVREDVPSPTFTLVQTYEGENADGPLPIHHFDLYRLDEPDDIRELDLEDALDHGLSLIEWPEIALAALPQERLEVHLAPGPDDASRSLTLMGDDNWANRLKAGL